MKTNKTTTTTSSNLVNPGFTEVESLASAFAGAAVTASQGLERMASALRRALAVADFAAVVRDFSAAWRPVASQFNISARLAYSAGLEAGLPDSQARKFCELVTGVSRQAISAAAKAMAAGSRSAAGLKNHGAPSFTAARVAEILKAAGVPLSRAQSAALAKAANKAAK